MGPMVHNIRRNFYCFWSHFHSVFFTPSTYHKLPYGDTYPLKLVIFGFATGCKITSPGFIELIVVFGTGNTTFGFNDGEYGDTTVEYGVVTDEYGAIDCEYGTVDEEYGFVTAGEYVVVTVGEYGVILVCTFGAITVFCEVSGYVIVSGSTILDL